MGLKLRLLGPPEVFLDSEPAAGFVSDKARALLFYLAVEADRAHHRETLAGLLWPDYPERSARTNLSNALSNLRTVLSDRTRTSPYLLVSRQTIQFDAHSDYRLDVQTFDARFEDQQWEDVAALSTGQFLEGFSLPDSPAFEQWALVVRERLQRQIGDALEALAAAYESHGDYARARATARHQLELEPWRESAHRTLVRCLALDGKRAAALTQYETCVRTLREELDVEPEPETVALAQQIRIGALRQASRGKAPASAPQDTDLAPSLPQAPPEAPVPVREVIPPAGERRLATVLYVEVDQADALLDVLGPERWTATMGGVLEALKTAVRYYGGEIHERRREGMIALFGVPSTHEDDAERAVLTALEIQSAIERRSEEDSAPELWLRAGVDTGEVLVTTSGNRRTVIGRALALARRACVAAEPGGVRVGENAYRLVRSLFEWEADSDRRRPLARRGQRGKGRGIEGLSAPLIGRGEELAALHTAVDDLQRGIGGIVTLVGEAGIGKSRLVTEVREQRTLTHHASRADHRSDAPQWVEGRCLSYGGSIAYHLWLDLLRSVLNEPPDAPPLAVRETLRAQVEALCPGSLDEVYPYLCKLMSLPLEDRYETLRGLQGESLRAEIFSAALTLVESAARQRPLVMVCEDLHWADATSLALLERLLAVTDRAALLLVCVFRLEVEHGCWRLKETAARQYRHRHTDLWLDALSADESQALVGHLLQIEALPTALQARILDHAEGNPFYVEEILRALIDDGTIVYDDAAGQWRAAPEFGREIADIPIPSTLHGVLAARIDRLPAETRRVLRLASVIGRAFTYRVLAEIVSSPRRPETVGSPLPLGEGSSTLDGRLLTLQRQQLIRERARLPELEYAFKHALTREAAYDGLLKQERLDYHRQVAEALERLYPDRMDEQAGLLAHHWERAEEAEKAISYLLQAGELARAAYANQEAIDSYRRALNVLQDISPGTQQKRQRLTALSGLGIVRFGTGQVVEAEASLREAIALGKEMGIPARELTRLYYWLGETLWWQDQRQALIQIGEEGLALLGDEVESVEAVLMNHLIGVAYADTDWKKGAEIAYQTAQFVHRLPYVEDLRPAYGQIIWAYRQDKDLDEAQRWTHILEEKARANHDLRGQAAAIQDMAFNCLRRGDLDKRLSLEQQALELYTRIGDTQHRAWAFDNIGATHLRLGRPQQARIYLQQSLEIFEAVGFKRDIANRCIDLGSVSLCQHHWEEAVGFFQKALALFQELDRYRWSQGKVIYLLGRANQAMGKYVEAARLFEKSVELELTAKEVPVEALNGLEQVLQDAQAFRILCHRLQKDYGQGLDSSFVQWYLEPTPVGTSYDGCPLKQARGLAFQLPGRTWVDPFGDGSYATVDGLELHAANGRDLWNNNLSAPRLLRPASGDLVVQAACAPGMEDRPAIGGLLLWKDERHFLCLERGYSGRRDILFRGGVDNHGIVVGRGLLPGTAEDSERIHLRLEWSGDRVSAFCSSDGEQWYTVGTVTFPVHDPIQVGVHAIGDIDRSIYHGAYPEGTAIRFESFQMWQT